MQITKPFSILIIFLTLSFSTRTWALDSKEKVRLQGYAGEYELIDPTAPKGCLSGSLKLVEKDDHYAILLSGRTLATGIGTPEIKDRKGEGDCVDSLRTTLSENSINYLNQSACKDKQMSSRVSRLITFKDQAISYTQETTVANDPPVRFVCNLRKKANPKDQTVWKIESK